MKKVFISTSSFGKVSNTPLKILKKFNIHFELNPYNRTLSEEEILKILSNGDHEGLIAGVEPLTERVLNEAKRLKVISRVGVGLDNIDIKAAERTGIKIYNTHDCLTDSVAELTIGLILDSLRKISLHNTLLKKGKWKKNMGSLLKDKRVGIIGCGKIGSRVAEILNFMGAEIVFCDICDISVPYKRMNYDNILKTADIITLHISGKEKILTKENIKLIKKGAIIINTSRGGLIDEDALYSALKNGDIAWACLDVFNKEPYNGPLKELENVTLTPHIGSYAKEARLKMELKAVDNLLKGLGIN